MMKKVVGLMAVLGVVLSWVPAFAGTKKADLKIKVGNNRKAIKNSTNPSRVDLEKIREATKRAANPRTDYNLFQSR